MKKKTFYFYADINKLENLENQFLIKETQISHRLRINLSSRYERSEKLKLGETDFSHIFHIFITKKRTRNQ